MDVAREERVDPRRSVPDAEALHLVAVGIALVVVARVLLREHADPGPEAVEDERAGADEVVEVLEAIRHHHRVHGEPSPGYSAAPSLQRFRPRQQNLWGSSGSGRSPSVWYNAISSASQVR